jgi:hypothetical protein
VIDEHERKYNIAFNIMPRVLKEVTRKKEKFSLS